MNIFKKIFSIKNEISTNKKHKVITFLGIKIKFKSKFRHKPKCAIIRNKEDYQKFIKKNNYIVEKSKKLAQEMEKNPYKSFETEGFCTVCNNFVKFKTSMFLNITNKALLPETLNCPVCGCSNRIRTMFYLLKTLIKKNHKILLLEYITVFYKNFINIFGKNNNIIGSEYLGDSIPSGTINKDGIRHEDALNLSFPDNTFDFLIANHVHEHVCDIDLAFKEAYRVLKKNGYLVFGIPFNIELEKTNVRAKIENKKLILLQEKEIHGNPLDSSGSLAFYNFGWDIFEKIKKAGFKDTYIHAILDDKTGNLTTYPMFNFVALK